MSAYSEMTIQQLLAERTKIDAQIIGISGATSTKAEKIKIKRKSGPTAWSDWTKKMLAENKEAVKAYTEAAATKLGAHLKWLSANKGKESPEWKAYQVEWLAAHPKDSDESVDSAASAASKSSRRGPKKLDEMTTEERSAHDASIAARRAKKEAEKVAGEAAGKAESAAAPVAEAEAVAPVSSASSVASEKKKSSYVKVADMTPEQLAKKVATAAAAKAKKAAKAAPAPKAATPKAAPKAATPKPEPEPEAEEEEEAEAEMELLPFKLDDDSYFRCGSKNADGSISWGGGDLWLNKGGVRGDYAGLLEDDGTIDTDAEEPNFA